MLSVRRAALDTVVRILEDGAYTNLALKDAAKTVSEKDVPFLYALVNETVVRSTYLDYLLAHYCKRPKRMVRNLLRMSGTELLFLRTPPHAAVQEAVSLCKEIGKAENAGFVNAVLRRLDRERDALPPLPDDPTARFAIYYGFPQFIVAEWIDLFGERETEALLSFPPIGTTVRAQYPFTTQALAEELRLSCEPCRLDSNALRIKESFDLERSELYQCGRMAIQSEGAMLICRALGDVHHRRILDACAAPGGKTAYLASLSENTADLTAWELHPHRKAIMDAAFSRLHVHASTACMDASVYHSEFAHAFDAVLLDVPCSGFGLLSDKPDVRLKKDGAAIDALVDVQTRILDACAHYLRSGGVLVYATCTISKRENSERVHAFLFTHPKFRLIEERQLLPTRDGTDGFYYAKLIGG